MTNLRAKFPLPLLIGLGIMAAIIVFALALTGRQAFQPEVAGAPHARVSQEIFDYGEMVRTTFTVKNVGDQPLQFLSQPYIEVLEGCCPPTPVITTMYLAPGEEATVAMNFSMHGDMGGPHEFLTHVETNDPANPHLQVRILSNWVG